MPIKTGYQEQAGRFRSGWCPGRYIYMCPPTADKLHHCDKDSLRKDQLWKQRDDPLRYLRCKCFNWARNYDFFHYFVRKQWTMSAAVCFRTVSEWVCEEVSEWASGWVGEWVSGWVSEWVSGCVGKWVNGWVGKRVREWEDECISGWVYKWVSG